MKDLHLSTPSSLLLPFSQVKKELEQIVNFLQKIWRKAGKRSAVIAVSGGIDSALALSILAKSLKKEQIFPLLLPFGRQKMADAWKIIDFQKIPRENCHLLNIQSAVETLATSLQVPEGEEGILRLGNIMARVRMIALYDFAKEKEGLVLGTMNKSEQYLGYFTRHGDQAADVEVLQHLYKTQLRQLASFLKLPNIFLEKAPSAELWSGQSDQTELGFSYQLADQVLFLLLDQKKTETEVLLLLKKDYPEEIIQKVLQRLEAVSYKQEVPYVFSR